VVQFELQDKISRNLAGSYKIKGDIQDFCVHPSHEYLIVLGTDITIFHIDSGAEKGKIPVPKNPKKICVDQSGLYVAVSTSNRVTVFEIVTGIKLYEFKPSCSKVGSFSFSQSSHELIIADLSRQVVHVYLMDARLTYLSDKIIEAQARDPAFWLNY
jgi:hypothetical protein